MIHAFTPSGRNVGKRMACIQHASEMAKSGKRVLYFCPSVTVQLHRELILQHNRGAWPIGLKVRSVGN